MSTNTLPGRIRRSISRLINFGAFARTATQALTNVTYRYLEALADHGLAEACRLHPALLGGINVMNGKLTHPAVAGAHGMKWEKPKLN